MDRWRVGSKVASGRKRDGGGQAKVGGDNVGEGRGEERRAASATLADGHDRQWVDTRPDHCYRDSVAVDVVQVNINIYPRDLD